MFVFCKGLKLLSATFFYLLSPPTVALLLKPITEEISVELPKFLISQSGGQTQPPGHTE